MRLTKFAPAAEKPPVVMPAPKISALAEVVVTVPLFADVPLPEAEVPTSNGLTGSRPLYSRARMSTNGVDVLKAHRHGIRSGGGRLYVLGVVDRLTDAATPRGWDSQLIHVASRVRHRGDVGGRVVPANGEDVGVSNDLRIRVGNRNRRLIGLRCRRIHLHKSRGRKGCRGSGRSSGRSSGGRRGCHHFGLDWINRHVGRRVPLGTGW